MATAFTPSHSKELGWRFFPDECVDRNFRPRQDSMWCEPTVSAQIEKAAEERAPFDAFGQKLAHHLQGSFFLGPNKTYESAVASLLRNDFMLLPQEAENAGVFCTDYLRGCILVEGNHGIVRARKKLRDIVGHEQDTFLQIKDRTSRPPDNGLRGIFMSVKTPGGHVAEIQIHTRAYWEEFLKTRDAFEAQRDFVLAESIHDKNYIVKNHSWSNGEEPPEITKEWNDEARGLSRRARSTRHAQLEDIAKASGINALRLEDKNYEGDCSFPLRPAIKGGQTGYVIAAGHEEKFIKSGYPYWDPTWTPDKGIDPAYI